LLTLLLLVGFFLACYLPAFDPKLDLNGDNAAYLALGKSLASGQGFHSIDEPGSPPGNHFPPGYPLFLSVLLQFSDNLIFLKAANGALFLAAAVLLLLLLRRLGTPPLFALGVSMALLANSHLVRFATILMSEIPFVVIAMGALLLLLQLPTEGEDRPWKSWRWWLLAALLVYGYYVRTAGVALLFGVLVHFAWNRRWQSTALTLVAFVAGVVPWILRGKALGGNSYIHQLFSVNPYRPELGQAGFGDLVHRFVENFTRYLHAEIPSALFPFLKVSYEGPVAAGEWIIGVLLVGLIGWGLWKLPSGRTAVGAYLVGSFGILLLWPEVWSGVRFMLGILPLLLALSLWGAHVLVRDVSGWQPPALWPVLIAVALVFSSSLAEVRAQAKAEYPPAWQAYVRLAEWVRDNTPANTVVVARKPQLFWVWSQRQTASYRLTTDAEALIAHMDSIHADLVVLEQLGYASTGRNLYPAMMKHQERFPRLLFIEQPVYTALHKFVKAGESAPVQPATTAGQPSAPGPVTP
jgi:hypothetical protein